MTKKPIGILMLDTSFPRILGDVGNPATWQSPVVYKKVAGASPQKIVREDAARFLDAFVEAGLELVGEGVSMITTSCGFLALLQKELEKALPVPVVTSSLLQVEKINNALGPKKIAGILTISASSISPDLLAAAGVPDGTPVETTEGGQEFSRAILENRPHLDIDLARQDNIEAAQRLVENHPDVGAIILECTNMPPYAAEIARKTGLPVYSIVTEVEKLYASLGV